MNKALDKQLRKYYRDIKKALIGNAAKRRTLLMSLKMNVENYIAENSVTDMQEILEQFGTPEEVTEAYLEQFSEVELSKKAKKFKYFYMIAVVLILGMILFFIAFIHGLRNRYVVKIETQLQVETITLP